MSDTEFIPDPKQLEAIDACCDITKRVVVVSGEPGTGKTTLMRRAYDTLTHAGYSVAICAPTGKAAKRVKEATGTKAVTIHQLLEYTHPGEPDPKTGKPVRETYPRRDRMNRLLFDVVLVDEYSMVNKEMHRNLFDALKLGSAVRVFGDIDQLPPVETDERLKKEPSPFAGLLANRNFTSIVLDVNHRQAEGSGIISCAKAINSGRIPKRNDEFFLHFTDQPQEALKALVYELDEQGIDFSKLENQILTPGNTSWAGAIKLNAYLQRLYLTDVDEWHQMPRHSWDKSGGLRLRVGEKVINVSNNYDLRPEIDRWEIIDAEEPEDLADLADMPEQKRRFIPPLDIHQIFNGETGIVTDITEFGEVIINLGDRTVCVPPEIVGTNKEGHLFSYDPRKNIELAYAVTTHKGQGSEYQHVIYVLNKGTGFVQSRKNIYTAVTRARKTVHVITDQVSLTKSIMRRD